MAAIPTRVGHWKADRCEVYVGRGSMWGNPYVAIGAAARSKHRVIEVADPVKAFEAYLLASPQLFTRLPDLRGKVLGCWCIRLAAPLPEGGLERCHAQVLARYADALGAPPPNPRHEPAIVREMKSQPWVALPGFDRTKEAPPHPLFDSEPTMTFEEWWKQGSRKP